jgi:type IV pilus assembly protein PilA
MIKNYKKGFTLIELLVVIAIIGVLAAVVLSATNSARTKGGDAAVQANLANIRSQAALWYDGTGAGSYDDGTATTACPSAVDTTPTLAEGVFSDSTISSAIVQATAQSTATACNSTTTTYAVAATLKTSPANVYCVDSNGAGKKSLLSSWAGGLSGAGATFALNTTTGLCN